MNELTIYEFPLNERIRLFIRLEQLFLQLDYFLSHSSIWDYRTVVTTLIDIVGVFNRNDLKSETLQEIDRQTAGLARMARLYDGIDEEKLSQVITMLEDLSKDIYGVSGKVGLSLMEDEFFKSIAQRSMPGGSCSFDLPAYHHWLEGDDEQRREDLHTWIQPFLKIRSAIDILLNFIRTSASSSPETAEEGFYQKTLDHSLPFQLLRVAVPQTAPYYAEISGGKHRFTIRFMLRTALQRPTQTTEDIDFSLACCLF